MGLGFTRNDDETKEEYIPLYETIIECPVCLENVSKLYKGSCSCKNLEIDQVETISKCKFTHLKTVGYTKEAPKIYSVLSVKELP